MNSISYAVCLGKVMKSRNYGDFVVIEKKNYRNVLIEFLDTGYKKYFQYSKLQAGAVKDVTRPTIYNVGFIGSKYPTSFRDVGGKKRNMPEYEQWSGFLRRCYDEKYHKKYQTYIGCACSKNFTSYEYYTEWCHKQIGFSKGWNLDKDLLVKGNKLYSEDTCVFIPTEINALLTKTNGLRGKYPIGVHFCNGKKKFVAQINRNKGQQDYLGAFDTVEEAFLAYKTAKEDFIKQVAEKWKGQIDPRAYEAMMKYEVEITD